MSNLFLQFFALSISVVNIVMVKMGGVGSDVNSFGEAKPEILLNWAKACVISLAESTIGMKPLKFECQRVL